MKQLLYGISLVLLSLNTSCQTKNAGGSLTQLDAKAFYDASSKATDALLLDVRSPEEFEGGHIANAENINWNGADFEKEVAAYSKDKTVYIYCLSGGRSGQAANFLRKNGYSNVIELNGGMMKWRSAGLPETSGKSTNLGMTIEQFNTLLEGDKLVLIDFYAEWCAPCKKMKPFLDALATEQAAKVTIVRIDADANKGIADALKIDALPTLILYKNKNKVWQNVGFTSKEEIQTQLNKN
jgi:thioredoxin 1